MPDNLVPPAYRQVQVVLRPTRVATAIPSNEWQITATRMLENYSRKWGGVGDIFFPVDEGLEVSTVWLSILAAFDPDRFAT